MNTKKHLFKIFAFVLIAVFTLSCSETTEAPQPQKDVTVQKVKKKKAPKKKQYKTLNNETAPAFLKKYGETHKGNTVEVTCKFGTITIKLYDDTPLHRANFLYMIERGYFDLTQFYRVEKDFIAQAGNSDDWDCAGLANKIGHYKLPNEINTNKHIHLRGAVAAARLSDNNPDKLSSNFEWYISMGQAYNEPTMRGFMREYGFKYSPAQVEAYGTRGGTPTLDKQYTVFGEVISGMDVVEKINQEEVDKKAWPKDIIPIKVKLID